MFKRCQHKWIEIKRTYNPPRSFSGPIKVRGEDTDRVLDIVEGYTNIELKCSECGDLKHKQVSGKT